MGTVKAGYLYKLSRYFASKHRQLLWGNNTKLNLFLGGFFKNSWKRRYFVLYQDGVFSYYQDSKDKESDGKIQMKIECRLINVGHAVGEGIKPPKEGDINAMFCVSTPERTWYLYAETESDARYRTNFLDELSLAI